MGGVIHLPIPPIGTPIIVTRAGVEIRANSNSSRREAIGGKEGIVAYMAEARSHLFAEDGTWRLA